MMKFSSPTITTLLAVVAITRTGTVVEATFCTTTGIEEPSPPLDPAFDASCNAFVIDFDTDKNGATVAPGTAASLVAWDLGMSVYSSFELSGSATPFRKALTFNANNPTGGDTDLCLPGAGNVLIIQENNDNVPDDFAGSGSLFFEFTAPVSIQSILFLDTEEQGTLRLFDSGGVEFATKDMPKVLNKNRESMPVEETGISKMEVALAGSGAVGNITFCLPPPSTGGDPHFATFHGQYWDYHGVCDLMFLDSPLLDLKIHIRTTQKYHYSYVSSAVIKLHDDIFEFGSWGQVIANGIYESSDADLPATIGGYPLTLVHKTNDKKVHQYKIDLHDEVSIEIKTYKEMVAVRLLGKKMHEVFADSTGMMGSPINGTKLGRNGQVWTGDDNSFGQEWQVLPEEDMLFEALREPQAPAQCTVPNKQDPKFAQARRLGESIARADAEQACKKHNMNLEACIDDVLTTGDLEVAAAFFD